MTERKDIRNKIRDNKCLTQYSIEELKYVHTPIGKGAYNLEPEIKVDTVTKKSPKDKIKCDTCGKEYTRSGSYLHKRTKHHMLHVEMSNKIKKLLLQ